MGGPLRIRIPLQGLPASFHLTLRIVFNVWELDPSAEERKFSQSQADTAPCSSTAALTRVGS